MLAGEQRTLPLGGARDIRANVERAAKGSILEARELVEAAGVLAAAARTKDFLEGQAGRTPRLADLGEGLVDLTTVARRIESSFEPSGEVSDRASPALAEARDRARGLHKDIKTRIEALIDDREMEELLREKYFTLRNDRYVVPVKAQHRSQVPGIVHNASQSGQTLFVEPQPLIGLGNELAIAQSMVLEEERRVLQELTDALGARSTEVLDSLDVLAQLDEAEACARLSNDLLARVPEITRPNETFNLRSLRHPLLILQGKHVIASDVRIEPPSRALIISGPNAGGKTVTLTGVGLCSLMLRTGLPVPVGEGSRMPLYPGVYAAIGDAQDLGRDLSTFSAHLTALREILARASPGALVLIDEMAADTDPREGAALASAVLEELLDRGATVMITTHLEELKALGLADKRFANAHVGFDPTKLAPTYKLHLGMPGASSAIEIARRVGLPEALCQRARAHLSGATGPLAAALESLENSRRALDSERAEAVRLNEETKALKAQLDRERAELNEKARAASEEARKKLIADLAAAQVQVSALVAELQVQPSLARAAEVQHTLRQREAEQKKELAKLEVTHPSASELEERAEGSVQLGNRVRIAKLDREGEVVEIKGGEAVVQAGALRMRLPLEDLVPLKGRARVQTKLKESSQGAQKRAEAHKAAPLAAPAENCDVRGLRADEALRMVEAFLDRLYGEGRPLAYIIHGHGTGALKASLREYLDGSPYVAAWKPAEANEGGDGATRVELRS